MVSKPHRRFGFFMPYICLKGIQIKMDGFTLRANDTGLLCLIGIQTKRYGSTPAGIYVRHERCFI